ncbi:MAG: phosphohistidine phosphatase SixA, partial [Deltaproteobacteria bacterium]|nr:phosphohistidine phosphatase SixA [Deltaproteobacteria bacterium]
MRRIYLMRHGRPVSKKEDPDRPLSDQGRDGVERIAGFIEKGGVRIEEFLHSGKTRARQTAEIMASGLNPGVTPVEKQGLSPMDDVHEVAGYINERDKDLMIAGHLPHLAGLTSLLVAGSESIPVASFQPGGVVCLEKSEGSRWSIVWMLVP